MSEQPEWLKQLLYATERRLTRDYRSVTLTEHECRQVLAALADARAPDCPACGVATPPPASVVERDANRYREGEKLPTPEGCCENGERDARNDPREGDVKDYGNGEVWMFSELDDSASAASRLMAWQLEYTGTQWFTREQRAARQKDGA